MLVYKKTNRGHLKWGLAALVFILTMTITWAQVYSFSFTLKPQHNIGRDDSRYISPTQPNLMAFQNSMGQETYGGATEPSNNDTPPAVPEPSTLILIGCGLGGLYFLRRGRSQ